MITRVEYSSADSRRTATVLWLGVKSWHVLCRTLDAQGRVTRRPKASYRTSLTSAQGMARAWTQK